MTTPTREETNVSSEEGVGISVGHDDDRFGDEFADDNEAISDQKRVLPVVAAEEDAAEVGTNEAFSSADMSPTVPSDAQFTNANGVTNRSLIDRAAEALQRTQVKLETDLQGYQARAANFFARKQAAKDGRGAQGEGFADDGGEDEEDDIDSTSDGTRSDHSNTLSGFSGVTQDESSGGGSGHRNKRRSSSSGGTRSSKHNSRLSTSSVPDSDALLRYRERQMAKIMNGGGGGSDDEGEDDDDDDTYLDEDDDVDSYRPHDDGDSSVGNGSFLQNPPTPNDRGASRTSSATRRRRRPSVPIDDPITDSSGSPRRAPEASPSAKQPHPRGPIVGYLRVPREEAMLLQQLRVLAKNAHRKAAKAASSSPQPPPPAASPASDVSSTLTGDAPLHPHTSATLATATHSHAGNINGPLGLDNVQLVRVVKAKKQLDDCAATVEKYASLCDRLGLRLITFDDVADVLSRRCMAVLDPLTLKVDDSYVFYIEGRHLMEVMAGLMDDLRVKKRAHKQAAANAAGAVFRTTSLSSQQAVVQPTPEFEGGVVGEEQPTSEVSSNPSAIPQQQSQPQSTATQSASPKEKKKGFFSNLFSKDNDKKKSKPNDATPANTTLDGTSSRHVDPTANPKPNSDPVPSSEGTYNIDGLNATEVQSVYTSVMRAMLFLIETRVVGLVHNNAAAEQGMRASVVGDATATTFAETNKGVSSLSNGEDPSDSQKGGDYSGAPGPDPVLEKKKSAAANKGPSDLDDKPTQSRIDLRSPDRISFVVCLDGVETSHVQSLLLHMKRFLADAYPIRICGIYLLNSHVKHIDWHLKRHGIAGSTATTFMGHLAKVEKDRRKALPTAQRPNNSVEKNASDYVCPPLIGVRNKFTYFLSVQTLKVQLLSVKMMRRLHTTDDLFDVVDVELLDRALRNAGMDGFLPPLPNTK